MKRPFFSSWQFMAGALSTLIAAAVAFVSMVAWRGKRHYRHACSDPRDSRATRTKFWRLSSKVG